MTQAERMTIHHIPVCPFSQRVEILLELKGRRRDVAFNVIDITRPRPDWLLQRTRGSTALPVLETADGRIVKESLVILRYVEDIFPDPPVAQREPYRRAVENMLVAMESPFVTAGYQFVMNQDPGRREALRDAMLALYAKLDDFLVEHAPDGTWLFEEFGLAEAVYAPMFMRFWFLDYYEGFELPDEPRFARVRRWRDACLAHPAARQVSREEIVKLYYDYARGAGNGALLPGRTVSSFAFEPHWSTRPMPPADKYGPGADDRALGLLA
ncbi:glutathione S-transferase family protein [Arenibaculum sp.]|jgi:glutathione S-transferase|uniref:glutathione S-transferase family protein n=1 Tax=Arenibaculum sp. TaxID=2865862 RepID=UPI002E0E04B7|nr:glutathione S-transferase family protein [Arenibaculum sp.]